MKKLLFVALTSHLLSDSPTISANTIRLLIPAFEGDSEGVLQSAKDLPDAESVAERLARLDEYADELQSLEEQGIYALIQDDKDYPIRLSERLGKKAPNLLFVAGATHLFHSDALGVVGSREIDDGGIRTTREVAVACAESGVSVVSGGARGVDQESMFACIGAGGSAVGFMADSLARALRSEPVREAIDDGRLCLATPYAPSAGFSVGNAMGRNKLIYAFGHGTLVVACTKGTGGTWAGATEALQNDWGPVLVWIGEGSAPDNSALVRSGAHACNSIESIWEERKNWSVPQPALL